MPPPDTYQLFLSRGLPDAAGIERLRRDLPEAEWRWITRLQRADDRRRSLVGRALIRRLLGRRLGLAPTAVPLGTGLNGKPVLVRHETRYPAHFNLAHSGDLILAGIGPGPLGVDVEHCPDQVDTALWRQITGHPSPDARGAAALPSPQAFCADWVRREAVLKACGLGLTIEPGTLRLSASGAAGWTTVAGRPEVDGLWVCLLWADPHDCAALCLPRAAASPVAASPVTSSPVAASSAGRPTTCDEPPPDIWSLRQLTLADWLDRADRDSGPPT
ncbi:MAG: 4'-phosphopantetheinyl transferase family protein [Castellaniella sp.]|uniref:4'-phosphopantetheinyl transferase family protein n=1 Tax=Castellaniella sp. TaxID=1955812 RepID=UPI003A881625